MPANAKPQAHGTDAGYQQHQRRGTPPCDECRDAHRAHNQYYRNLKQNALSTEKLFREEIYGIISEELDHAYAKHGSDKWGRHEFYAILKEEVDEMWDSIKRDEPLVNVRSEAIQVAAMVFRYLETGDRYQN